MFCTITPLNVNIALDKRKKKIAQMKIIKENSLAFKKDKKRLIPETQILGEEKKSLCQQRVAWGMQYISSN